MRCRKFYTIRYRNCVAGFSGIITGTLTFSTYRIPFDQLERFTRCQRTGFAAGNPTLCPYPEGGSAFVFFYALLAWAGCFGLLGFLLSIFTPVPRHAWAIVWCEHLAKFSLNLAIGCLVHLLFVFPFIAVVPENDEAADALKTFVVYAYFIWYFYILAYGLLLLMSMCVLDYLKADQIAANNRAIAREDAITAYQNIFREAGPPVAPYNEAMTKKIEPITIRMVSETDHRQVPLDFKTKNFLNKSYKMRYIGLVLTTSFFVFGICVGAGYARAAPECSMRLTSTTGPTFQCVPVASLIFGAIYGLIWSGVFYLTVFSRAIPKVGLYGKQMPSMG